MFLLRKCIAEYRRHTAKIIIFQASMCLQDEKKYKVKETLNISVDDSNPP